MDDVTYEFTPWFRSRPSIFIFWWN